MESFGDHQTDHGWETKKLMSSKKQLDSTPGEGQKYHAGVLSQADVDAQNSHACPTSQHGKARGWHCHDQANLQGWVGKFVLPYPFWLNWNPQYSWLPHVLAVCLITLFSHHHSINHYPIIFHDSAIILIIYDHHYSYNLPTAFSIIPSYIPFLSQLYIIPYLGLSEIRAYPPTISNNAIFNGNSG